MIETHELTKHFTSKTRLPDRGRGPHGLDPVRRSAPPAGHRDGSDPRARNTPERLKATHVGDKIVLGFDDETFAARAASPLPYSASRYGAGLRIGVTGTARLAPGILTTCGPTG
jgi:hypothetical protein